MKLRTLAGQALGKYRSLPAAAKVSFWFIVCSVFQKGLSFLTTPIFTRIMSTEHFGQVTLYNSWINIICIFTTLNLQYGSFNTAQVKFPDDRKAYTSSIQSLVLLLSGATLLLVIGLSILFPTLFSSVLELPTILLLVMIVHINTRFNTELWMSNCRFDYRYKAMTVVILLSSLLAQMMSLMAVMASAEKGYMRIVAMALVEILFGIIIGIYNYRNGKKFFHKTYWKFALGFNLPLIPYYLSQIVFSVSDRIMISKMVGTDTAGIYGLAHTIALLLVFVVTAIRNSYTPWFFKHLKSQQTAEVKKFNIAIAAAIGAILLAFVFVAPELLLIMGGPDYYEAVWIIPPLVAGVLFEFFTDPACNVLFFFEKKGSLVAATIGCAVFNIVFNYLGIRLFGYFATAYVTLFSYILFWLFLHLCAKRICRKNNYAHKDILPVRAQLLLGLAFVVLTAGSMLLYPLWYVRYGVLLIAMIILAINYKKIIALVQKLLAMRK